MWTQGKERALKDAEELLVTLRTERDAARLRIATAIEGCLAVTLGQNDIDNLISSADRIRDALSPFDSGIRVEEKGDGLPTKPPLPVNLQLDDFGNEPKSNQVLVFSDGMKRRWIDAPPVPSFQPVPAGYDLKA